MASNSRPCAEAAFRVCEVVPRARPMSALGHSRTLVRVSGMSALPPEADMLIVGINVCYVPEADTGKNIPASQGAS